MRQIRQELTELLDGGIHLATQLEAGEHVENRGEEIRRGLAAYTPTMMFYGCYNAGKSTLLNAILGDDVAAVSDAPCTSSIDEHRFGEYLLYDTPGIDAPQDHEAVSNAHLQRTHVVVFVISTGGTFDEADTIRKLGDLYRSGKPLLIVLNDKNGFGVNSPEVFQVRDQFLKHLALETGNRDIEREVPILLVNAKTALTGRRTGKEKLLMLSGVPALETLMLQTLISNTGARVLLPPAQSLAMALEAVREAANRRTDNREAAAINGLLERVERARIDFLRAVETDIRALRGMLIDEAVAAIGQGTKLDGVLAAYVEKVQGAVDRRLVLVAEELGSKLEAELAGGDGLSGTQDIPGWQPGDTGARGPSIFSKIDPKAANQFCQSDMAIGSIKQGLLKLRELKLPGIKGRWSSTLDKWAGNLGRGIGAAIQVALVLYQMYEANQAQVAYEESMRERQVKIRNAAQSLALDCERDIVAEMPALSREAFGTVVEELEARAEQVSTDGARMQRLLSEVDGLRRQLDELIFEIQGAEVYEAAAAG